MLKIVELAMLDKRCAVRMCVPEDGSGFIVSAVARNGMVLTIGCGETLEAAVRDMLADLGIEVEDEQLLVAY
jgi:hypothetical protein